MQEGGTVESPNWSKRLRMSGFVQQGRMTFGTARSDEKPADQGCRTYHVLLRDGTFSHARLYPGWHGDRFWAHPNQYLSGGNWGVFGWNEVVAWKEKEN